MTADATQLITALGHPVRRRILRRFCAVPDTKTSASYLSKEFELPLGNVSYHLQALAGLEVLSLAEVRPIRGAKEFLYASNLDDRDEWFRVALEESRPIDER